MAQHLKIKLCSDDFTHPIVQCGTQKTYSEYISTINNSNNIDTIIRKEIKIDTEFFDWTPIDTKITESAKVSPELKKSQE